MSESAQSVGGAYLHRFLQGQFPNADSKEPELFYFTHFWSSGSVNAESKLVFKCSKHHIPQSGENRATTGSVQQRAPVYIALNIPAWQLSQSVPGSMSSFHNNFWVILYSSWFLSSSTQNNARRTCYLIILLSWCFDFNVFSSSLSKCAVRDKVFEGSGLSGVVSLVSNTNGRFKRNE